MNEFKYYIVNKDFHSFYVNNGNVYSQGMQRELQAAPDGWQDIAISYERNMTYRSLFRNFSVPLGFVKDGAKILQHIFYTYGIEEKIYLIILKRSLTYIHDVADSYQFTYKSYYRGEFDFSTYVQEENKVTINLLDGGLEAIIKANETAQYDIPIDGLESKIVRLDGVELYNKATGIITDGMGTDINYLLGSHIVDVQIIQKEVDNIGGVKNSVRTKVANSNTNKKATGQWILKATVDTMITINYDFILTVNYLSGGVNINPTAFLNCSLQAINEDGVLTNEKNKILINKPVGAIVGSHHAQGIVTIPVNTGDELYLYTFVSPSGAGGDAQCEFKYSGEGKIEISYVYKHPESNVTVITAYELFKRLIAKMTDNRYAIDSEYLKSRSDIVLTSGDSIRRMDEPKIKTSFSDFWKWLTSLLPVSFSIRDNKAYIGDVSESYNNSNPIDIGDVRNLNVKVATELLFSNIKLGYSNQNYEDINGRSEFNSTQYWGVNVIRSRETLDMISPYRADCIGIEYLRINFGDKKTTDSGGDNDVFVLHIEKQQNLDESGLYNYYKLDRSENAVLTGVISPSSMFNVSLRPRNMLINNGSIFHSSLDKMENKSIAFQSADKNAETSVNGIADKSNLSISSLKNKLYLPYVFEFETYKPINLVELMNDNDFTKHCIKFGWQGNTFLGYILKAGLQPATNEVQTFTLLCDVDNDMNKLI